MDYPEPAQWGDDFLLYFMLCLPLLSPFLSWILRGRWFALWLALLGCILVGVRCWMELHWNFVDLLLSGLLILTLILNGLVLLGRSIRWAAQFV